MAPASSGSRRCRARSAEPRLADPLARFVALVLKRRHSAIHGNRGRARRSLDGMAFWRQSPHMAPRSRSPSEAQRAGAPASLAPEDRDLVRAGLEAAERGEGHDLTEKEAAHYYETGSEERLLALTPTRDRLTRNATRVIRHSLAACSDDTRPSS
jgi:hypothetical protein